MGDDGGAEGRTRLLVVDDHDLFGQSLTVALRLDGFDTERVEDVTPAGILDAAEQFDPEVVLLDLDLGPDGPTGVALAPQLCERGATVVTVTGIEDPARMGECLAAGAISVVNKSEPYERLLRAVREATRGRSVLSEQRRHELLAALRRERSDEAGRREIFERLTPSEQAVLAALMEGKSPDTIASERFVTVRTVRTQIEAILSKLQVRSQLGAVSLAWRLGWQYTPPR